MLNQGNGTAGDLPENKARKRLFYGWVMIAAFLVFGIVLFGINSSFGFFFKSIEGEFNLTRAVTSAITSTNQIIVGICALITGLALDRYGPKTVVLIMGIFAGLSLLLTSQTTSVWQLFVTYSVLLSIGIGPAYVVLSSTISRWFDKKRGIALGISGAGLGLGTIVISPLATYLISNFDWRTAYMVIGLLVWIVVIPISWLLKRDPRDIGALPDGMPLACPHKGYHFLC